MIMFRVFALLLGGYLLVVSSINIFSVDGVVSWRHIVGGYILSIIFFTYCYKPSLFERKKSER